jgi:hypothetical protein
MTRTSRCRAVVAGGLGIAASACLSTGCLGSSPDTYGRWQRSQTARRDNAALLRAFAQPRYRIVMAPRFEGTSYRVTLSKSVVAQPYSTMVRRHAVVGRGQPVLDVLLRVGRRDGWKCEARPRGHGTLRALNCRRGTARVRAVIFDDGDYELRVTADARRAPIQTVPGD